MGSKAELRQRKKAKSADIRDQSGVEKRPADNEAVTFADLSTLAWLIWSFCGVAVLGYLSYWFAWYVQALHENQMWFSHISEVEREISLRTECGLYYSYFKQLVNAEKFWVTSSYNHYFHCDFRLCVISVRLDRFDS